MPVHQVVPDPNDHLGPRRCASHRAGEPLFSSCGNDVHEFPQIYLVPVGMSLIQQGGNVVFITQLGMIQAITNRQVGLK